MQKYDAIVVGCGIIGAAVSMELAKYNLKICILEKENDVSLGTTRANSAIIHAGYDPKPGTLMAKLNVRGSVLAKEICSKLDVPYKNNGALVVAFSKEELSHLDELLERGRKNGVEGLRIMNDVELHNYEPGLSTDALGALYAPTSAIVSPWEYCLAMAETAVRNGAELKLNAEVTDIRRIETYKGSGEWACGPEGCHLQTFDGRNEIDYDNFGWIIETKDDEFFAKYVINCAGADAIDVHNLFDKSGHRSIPRRGEYYLLDKSEGTRVHSTVFQCPNELGKGVLVSPTVHGNLIVGPNAEDVEDKDLNGTSNTLSGLEFVRSRASRSVPGIDFGKSIRNFAGVRAVTEQSDFIITETARGFIDCMGICSPGLSAAPAIGEYVAELLQNDQRADDRYSSDVKDSVTIQKTIPANSKRPAAAFEKKSYFIFERKRIRFNELSHEEQQELIKNNPSYARVICRCETVTEGEILDCMNGIIPPVSIDGVKRRVGTGMGRCQGGFCGPRIAEIFEQKLGDILSIIQDRKNSKMFFGRTKDEKNSYDFLKNTESFDTDFLKETDSKIAKKYQKNSSKNLKKEVGNE